MTTLATGLTSAAHRETSLAQRGNNSCSKFDVRRFGDETHTSVVGSVGNELKHYLFNKFYVCKHSQKLTLSKIPIATTCKIK